MIYLEPNKKEPMQWLNKEHDMKKLLLLCAMSAITTVSLYGGSLGHSTVSEERASEEARQLVTRYGPYLDDMARDGYKDMLISTFMLSKHADPKDLIIDKIKASNRIYAKYLGGYRSMPMYLREIVSYLPLYDRSKLAEINRRLDAMGY